LSALASNSDWQALESGLAGAVALPGSASYEEATRPFNARFHHVRPQAVVRCASSDDVSETVAFVARHGLRAVARSGGHCFAGHSSIPGVVIDVTPIDGVTVDAGTATVGTGARLGPLYDALQGHGLAIPAGTCPLVGVAGLALGGGLGVLGRKHGLTCDQLIAAEVVVADGRVLSCDESHDADLFWALRGAGAGHFGVVTSLVFRTVPAPPGTNFHLAWPHTSAAAVIDAWQGWAPSGPDELAASVKVTASEDADRPPSVDLYGVYLGSESDAEALLEGLVSRVGADPSWSQVELLPFPEIRRFWAQLPSAEQHRLDATPVPTETESHYLVSRSEFFRRPLSTGAIRRLLETFTGAGATGEARELDFMPWGGAYNRVPADATAFVHRGELFQLKHSATVRPDASITAKQAAHRHVRETWASVHPWGSGRVFPNFPDPDLDGWADAYYGTNYDRLVQIKARYDPGELFRFPQSLPVPSSGRGR
jgi:FAD/FMN-containing dehydrogenase